MKTAIGYTCHGTLCPSPSPSTTHALTWVHLSCDWAHLHVIGSSLTSTIKSHTSQHSMSDLIASKWTHRYYSLQPTNFQPRILFTCCLVSIFVSSCFHRPVFPNSLQRKDPSLFEVWAQHHPTSSWQGNYILRYKSISTVITISSLYSPYIALLFNKHHLFAFTLCVRSAYVTEYQTNTEHTEHGQFSHASRGFTPHYHSGWPPNWGLHGGIFSADRGSGM